jgi:chitin synthase
MTFIFSLILVGSLFATFSIIVKAVLNEEQDNSILETLGLDGSGEILIAIYAGLLIVFVIMAVTKPIKVSTASYTAIVFLNGFLMSLVTLMSIYYAYIFTMKDGEDRNEDNRVKDDSGDENPFFEIVNKVTVILAVVTLFASYFIPIIININKIKICRYIIGVFCLIFLTPTYINIFMIYSIANLHDISWGNRDTGGNKNEETKKNLQQFRSISLIVWLFINIVYAFGMLYLVNKGSQMFLLVFITMMSITNIGKLIISIFHKCAS